MTHQCQDGWVLLHDVSGGDTKPLRCPKCNKHGGNKENEVPPEVVMAEIKRANEINGTVEAKVRAV